MIRALRICKRIFFLGPAVAFAILLSPLGHGACLNQLVQETPTADFDVQGAVVVHRATGLMWMRCSLGQQWDEEAGSCRHDASRDRLYTWPAALAAAETMDLAGYRDWRLPNKNELASIVERACTGPAINEEVFPDTPLAAFWTASPSLALEGFAWRVGFITGDMIPFEMVSTLNVRLVRDP